MKELCVETNLALSFQGATAEFKTQFISTWQRCKNEALLVVDTKQSEMPTWQSHYQSSNKKKQQYENSILHRLGCDWANLSGGRMPNPTAEKMTALQNQKRREDICSPLCYLCNENRNKGTCRLPSGSIPCFSGLQMQTTAAALRTWMPQSKIHPWDEHRPLNIPKNLHITCRVKSIWSSQLQKNKHEQKKPKKTTHKYLKTLVL